MRLAARAQLFVMHLDPLHRSWAVTDLLRSRRLLLAENVLLREQLLALRRQIKRPSLTAFDRAVIVVASALTETWRESVLLVKPETILPASARISNVLAMADRSCHARSGRPLRSPLVGDCPRTVSGIPVPHAI